MKHREEKIGEVAMFFEVILHSLWPVAAHYGASVMPQILFLAWITILGAPVFLIGTLWKKQISQVFKNGGLLLLYTLLIAVIPYGIITYATRYTTAINTTLLPQSETFYALLIGWLFLGDRIEKNRVLGALGIVLGNVIILYSGGINFNIADLALFLAPVFFVFGNIIAKRLQSKGVGHYPILLFRGVVGGVILLTASRFVEGPLFFDFNYLYFLVGFGVLFGVSKVLWQIALHRLDVSKVTALGMTYPLFSLIIAYFWLGEVPDFYQWWGILFISVGVLFLTKTRSSQWMQEDL